MFLAELLTRAVNFIALTLIVVGFNAGYCTRKRWGRLLFFYGWLGGIFVTAATLLFSIIMEKEYIAGIKFQNFDWAKT